MNKFILKIRLIWFMVKSVFGTKIEELQAPTKDANSIEHTVRTSNTIRQFFEKYDITKEDKVDYTNTHKHFATNYKHLDDANNQEFKDAKGGDRVLEIAGLLYEVDNVRVPRNAAEVFDMTYEEYDLYKEKILPIARKRTIKFEDVQLFIAHERSGIKQD